MSACNNFLPLPGGNHCANCGEHRITHDTSREPVTSGRIANLKANNTDGTVLDLCAELETARKLAQELYDAAVAMDTSYGTSDFLLGDKSRRLFAALSAWKEASK